MDITLATIFIVAFQLYYALVVLFITGWKKNKAVKSTKETLPHLSCIIALRNEEHNINALIENLSQLNYPKEKLEFIFVNDHSTDQTQNLLLEQTQNLPNSRVIESSLEGKKQAIKLGVTQASNEYIVVTDADCQFGSDWLLSMGSFFVQEESDLISGPVYITHKKSFGQFFQSLDFMSLVGSGAGAIALNHPIMCNGANLAYKKEAFLSVSEELKEEYLSGDDIFLLHAFKARGFKCSFIKDSRAIVSTSPIKSIKEFFHQRVRWAAKSKGYTDTATLVVAWLVLITNILVIFSIPTYFISPIIFRAIMTGWFLKMLIDTIFLVHLSRFFHFRMKFMHYMMSQILYPFYIVLTVIWAVFGKTSWKNRKF